MRVAASASGVMMVSTANYEPSVNSLDGNLIAICRSRDKSTGFSKF